MTWLSAADDVCIYCLTLDILQNFIYRRVLFSSRKREAYRNVGKRIKHAQTHTHARGRITTGRHIMWMRVPEGRRRAAVTQNQATWHTSRNANVTTLYQKVKRYPSTKTTILYYKQTSTTVIRTTIDECAKHLIADKLLHSPNVEEDSREYHRLQDHDHLKK